MLDHMILTVSDVERSLAFYEATLKPLNISEIPAAAKQCSPLLWPGQSSTSEVQSPVLMGEHLPCTYCGPGG